MRLFNICMLTAAMGVCGAASVPAAQNGAGGTARIIETICSFDTPQFTIETNGYSRISIGGCATSQSRGKPQMPFRTVRLLLPPSSVVAGLSCRAVKNTIVLQGERRISFGRQPQVLGHPAHTAVDQRDVPDPAVYQSTSNYPAAQVELVSVQRMAGYDIALLRVFPVQYSPASGRLVFTPSVLVAVEVSRGSSTAAAANTSLPPSGRAADRQRVAAAVDNPDLLTEYGAIQDTGRAGASSLYDYLLVTRSTLLTSFDSLVSFHGSRGLAVKTDTMESITNSYAGRDSAEKLRNYIRYAYTNWGVRYVLLGGNVAVVPYRGVYAHCDTITTGSMPSDLYFACLDGSWDAGGGGNGVWGEPNDGDGGGDVDLTAEVFVGRAPVGTTAEVNRFVAKTLLSQTNAVGRIQACLAGEYLDYVSGAFAQGGDALDTLLPALQNSHSQAIWLDDRPGIDFAWGFAEALAALNRSPLLVAHYGHSDETTVMRLGASDLDSLTNAAPFLFYSTGCDAGAFDSYYPPASIGEQLVIRNSHGAFATLANSREGWFDGQHEWLYSGEYQKCFFDGLLTGGRSSLGEAHQLAKQDMIGSVETSGDMPYRWCYFGITLLGDPCAAVRVPVSLCFRLPPDSSSCVVEWNSKTNATYSLFRTVDLLASNTVCVASNIVAVPPLNTYTDAVGTVDRAFYRIREER
ncbi:MAG: hypothetical protein C0404_00640 [Verrucomicrobia bacterium]|nr:hypothetical protein [Verrucomicrobiota bacterium]